jgi:hypothetical protein
MRSIRRREKVIQSEPTSAECCPDARRRIARLLCVRGSAHSRYPHMTHLPLFLLTDNIVLGKPFVLTKDNIDGFDF